MLCKFHVHLIWNDVVAACMGIPAGKSFMTRWMNPDDSFKYHALCPTNRAGMSITHEGDCKVVATLMQDLFRLDATRPVKENYETDLLRTDGRALAFFNDKSGYSDLGMFIWTNFWIKDYNFGHISKILRATDSVGIQKVAEGNFTL